MLGASSSAWAGVTRMNLIAPNVGWATIADNHSDEHILLWTVDGGVHWRDITPNPFANSEKGTTPERVTLTR